LDTLTQKFNGYQADKLFILLNEIQSYGGSFKDSDKLKSLITDSKRHIQLKGKEGYDADCFENYVMLSNNDWTVRVEVDDRRYVCTRISGCRVKDKGYFDKLGAALSPETAAKFMYYLMNRSLIGWNPRVIPDTELRSEMKLRALHPVMQFAIEIARGESDDARLEPEDEASEIRVKKQDFYGAFVQWCGKRRVISSENITGFVLFMDEKLGIKLRNLRWKDE